jgi:hypothetical protein
MNTQLEKLFEQYHLSEKNRYEINQIFWLLPINRQHNLINNFDVLAVKLNQIETEINLERRILIWDIFKDIKLFYKIHWDKI